MHRVLREGATYAGEATVRGVLLDLGAFPALVRSKEPTDAVHGELYALTQPSRVLLDLDDYEGEAFRRERVEAVSRELGRVVAWAYVWTGDVEGLERVEGGRWPAR